MTARDWSLNSGERQTSPWFEDANAAHRERYMWAAKVLGWRGGHARQSGIDAFCGTGYGTNFLVERTECADIVGLDGSREAIAVARAAHRSGHFRACSFPAPFHELARPGAEDFIVSLESIEHVVDDACFVRAFHEALRPGGDLLVSVPNETRLPLASFRNQFHVRHYTRHALRELLTGAGFEALAWYGQNIHRYVGDGPARDGRIPDVEQVVFELGDGGAEPCCWLVHCRKGS